MTAAKLAELFRHALGHHQAGRLAEALRGYDAVLRLAPGHPDTLNNRGVAFHALGRLEDSLASFAAALSQRPDHAETLNNRGNLLRAMGRSDEALASYEHAIRARPDFTAAWISKAALLWEMRNLSGALASLEKARALQPAHPAMLLYRGVVLRELRRLEESLQSLDAAIKAEPALAEACYQRGQTLQMLDRLTEAAASFEQALALDPSHAWAPGALASAALQLCDWPRAARAGEALATDHARVQPLTALGLTDDPAQHLIFAQRMLQGIAPPAIRRSAKSRPGPIRVAYLSADFKDHATAWLAAELFEGHDRARIETWGISTGPDDGSAMRRRLENGFDHFLDMRQGSDDAVARQLAALDIDILADLNGHTYGGRPGIAARRPAPVQVSFLGYPGSMGADFFDYVIGDETVLPNAQQPHYREKIVQLSGCYQINSRRMVAQSHSSRADCGLPEQGFVFCCFNNSWKISAPLFAAWMRLLSRLPQSVLWLMAGEETAAHLHRAAKAQGIDPRRLIFAPRLSQSEHLARHRHADLFLDTLPYNAHTTASDALWMGLPLITCLGNSFAGRVAASILKAAGLPELVTASLEDYEALALRLAREPLLLQSFRGRLAQPQANPLFDSARFCRKLETAYEKMMVPARAGELPRGFAVTQ